MLKQSLAKKSRVFCFIGYPQGSVKVFRSGFAPHGNYHFSKELKELENCQDQKLKSSEAHGFGGFEDELLELAPKRPSMELIMLT